MQILGLNHAVLYVRDARRSARFYQDVLGFRSIIEGPDGDYLFLRAAGSDNHHDLALFAVGEDPSPSSGGVGLYHLAWQVGTVDELAEAEVRLREAGALVGASDHAVNKSLYGRDPDGIEFEVMFLTPAEEWGDDEHRAVVRPLDFATEHARERERRAAGRGSS